MATQDLILFLAIGVVAGWLAGKIMKGRGFGIVGDLVLGVIGAFVGGWVFGLLGISHWGVLGTLASAVVGAILLLWVIRLVKRA
ncbi:MAG TPA: GlsB/YeaQ/YmgE family stress response membrane protein [Gemmatimonadales bacterium]|jgi:uncharacterized membrane protein YeaQ/YmgE (transglycosylase-associated protein family)|nr:GlsB/YeaQ/YmgE family stress response membrane protein [Gemmatimonadales bacterium]